MEGIIQIIESQIKEKGVVIKNGEITLTTETIGAIERRLQERYEITPKQRPWNGMMCTWRDKPEVLTNFTETVEHTVTLEETNR